MNKKPRQKFKYLENEKRFSDEIKSIFHYFQRAFIEENKTILYDSCQKNIKEPAWAKMETTG